MPKLGRYWLMILILVSLVPLVDFVRPGLPWTHDGRDHVARIANFYQSFSEGNLIPRWAANLNWGFGHPILMFLYSLPSYLGSGFHLLGFSLVASTKIVFGLSFVFSGVFMYLWIRELWGKEAGLVSGVLYTFAPYRFVDLYVRGAIGECWAFVWQPLVCWFLFKLSRTREWKYLVGGSSSLAALILSHNALSLMFLPVLIGYGLFLVFQGPADRRLLRGVGFSLLIVFGFLLAAFFWLPALYEGKYTLREIVTKDNITGFGNFPQLFSSPWSYGGSGEFSLQLGFLQWLAMGLAFVFWRPLFHKKKREEVFFLFLGLCFGMAIFLVLPVARPLYLKISFLQKFQFAWRFLSLALLAPAVFGGALISLLSEKSRGLGAGLVLLAALSLTRSYWHPQGFLYQEESFFTAAYPGTTDTGESSPRWSVRFMEDYPGAPAEVIEGEGVEIQTLKRLSNRHLFKVRAGEKSRLVDNTLYFPGWRVLVDGRETEIEFQDPNFRGLLTFWVEPGEHSIEVVFQETRFRFLSDVISLVGLAGLAFTGIIRKRIGFN